MYSAVENLDYLPFNRAVTGDYIVYECESLIGWYI